MSDKTTIEWTDATWNPVTGCTKVSPGCDHCYAETFAERFRGTPGHYFENGFDVQLRPDKLDLPLRWTKPRRIFVNSMSDLFHDQVPDEYIAKVFAVMTLAPQHTFQLLTKRHARMRALLSSDTFREAVRCAKSDRRTDGSWAPEPLVGWPLANVWLGVSVENQQWADIRIPALLKTSAAVRFVSCEPLLGPVDLRSIPYRGDDDYLIDSLCRRYRSPGMKPTDGRPCTPFSFGMAKLGGIDWVIAGGESGRGARPMHPDWVRALRDQCDAAGVPFLFKQWGEWTPDGSGQHRVTRNRSRYEVRCLGPAGEPWTNETVPHPGWAELYRKGKHAAGRELDGRTWDGFPAPRRHPATPDPARIRATPLRSEA